jgi:hypothetical protein
VTGQFRLAWQRGQSAAFAEVSLSCRWGERGEFELRFPPDLSPYWTAAVRFGAQVFWAALVWGDSPSRGLTIEIEDVRYMAVDTTSRAVAYATFRALCAATGKDGGDAFTFDETSGRFGLGRATSLEP